MARPIDPDARRHVVTVRVGDRTKEWLSLWRPTAETSTQLADVIERAQKFWPEGPDVFGHGGGGSKPAKERKTPAIAREASRRGIPEARLLNEMWRVYNEQQKQDQQKRDDASAARSASQNGED